MQIHSNLFHQNRLFDIALTILILGSLWGLSETAISEFIKTQGLPLRAGILTGIGMSLMGIAIGLQRKPWILLVIALITVFSKQLVVPVLHCSILCKANSCAAVGLQGIFLSGTIALAGNKLRHNRLIKIVTPFLAAFGSAGAFYFIGMRLAPCPYLLTFNHPGGLISFLAAEGLAWASFSALLFPAGYWIGAQMYRLEKLKTKQPLIYYLGSLLVVVISWSAISLTMVHTM